MGTKLYIFITLFLSTVSIIYCNGSELSRTVPKHDRIPKIDGILDEEIWNQSLEIENFIQRIPKEGAAPSERTVVHVHISGTK